MKQRFAIRNLLIASAVSLVSGLFAGLQKEDQSDFTIRSDVRLVLLDVSVKDREGGFVSGLAQDNFSVFENGRPQKITVFANDDLPVTVGILVDESFSMRAKRDDVLTAAQTFIEESNPRDEIFVLNFNDRVTRGLPGPALFSDNIQQLRSALQRGVPQGKTALNDAIVDGLKQLELGRRDKKTLIVISDGGDNASEHGRADMLGLVEKSTATIYTIGLYDAEDPDRNPGILKELARISGGEAYFPADPSGMVPVCRRIAKDIRARYTLGYLPPAENGPGSLRHVRVRAVAADRARLVARTRTSYRYDEVKKQEKK
ncbi:MAG: VWA domain-containing protein [Acidobacteriia bacterium]|nr:VWA domain-containing protein [Terriglobia bacterium]